MADDIINGWEALTVLTLPAGVIFMMMSLNGPCKHLRTRKTGILTEGTVVDTKHVPAENFRDHKNSAKGWPNGGWCPIYSYRLADGSTMQSSMNDLSQWRPRKEDVTIGAKVPLYYNRSIPSQLRRADLPLFDVFDVIFFVASFAMIAMAVPHWPKAATAGIAIVALWFGWLSGHFRKEIAQ